MENLEETYPALETARASVAQGEFEHAIEVYSEILDGINPDEESVPYLYVEYCGAIIANCSEYFVEEITRFSRQKGFSLDERKNIEDDLENAWNLLEISKNAFNILRDDKFLAKAHFLLGEISLLNNEFNDAIHDYTECLNVMERIYQEDSSDYIEVYLSMANAYEFLDNFDMAITYYNKIIRIYKYSIEKAVDLESKDSFNALISETLEKIKDLEIKKENIEDVRKGMQETESNNEDNDVVIDINSCKKRK